MAKIFVSYSRKDIEFAKRLTAELQKSELDFWIDWEGIPPTVDWWKEIEKGIEEADVFLFLISPDSAKSKICGKEIDTAVKNGKRIIPIVVREIQWEDTPPQLGHLNYIFFSRDDDFDTAVKKLMTAIQTDYEWAATHRRLQVKALEWQRNHKENSFLLRGKDLLDAETNLAVKSSKAPHPTDLQREYALASRKATDRQRRITTAISTAGVFALALLAIFGINKARLATNAEAAAVANLGIAQTAQVNEVHAKETAIANEQEAKKQAAISKAGELAALAILEKDKHFDLSLLLAVESFDTYKTARTRGTLLAASDAHPQLKNYLFGHTEFVNDIAFNPSGTLLASGSYDASIILWTISDANAPSILVTLKQHEGAVTTVAFDQSGKLLATGSANRSTIIWDITNPGSPVPLAKFEGNTKAIADLTFSTDGYYLLVADSEDVNLWDVHNPRMPISVDQVAGEILAFSPDGDQMALRDEKGDIAIWDISNPIQPFLVTAIPPYSFSPIVAFSYDGQKLATGGKGTLILWDIANPDVPSEIYSFSVNSFSFASAVFSPDGANLISLADSTIIWDITNPINPSQSTTLAMNEGIPVFSPDGKQMASGSRNGTIILWNRNDWEAPSHLTTFATDVSFRMSLAISRDGTMLAEGNGLTSVVLWDIQTGSSPTMIGKLKTDGDLVYSVSFSDDGHKLISADEKSVIVWDIHEPSNSSRLRKIPIQQSNHIYSALNVDGSLLALMNNNEAAVLWDISDPATPQKLGTLPDGGTAHGPLALHPNNQILASVDVDNGLNYSIVLWDISNLEEPVELSRLFGHSDEIASLTFDDEGEMMASGSSDGSMILWDISNPKVPQQLVTLSGPAFWILQAGPPFNTVAFNPAGAQVATAGSTGITLWDLNSESLLSKACQRAGRNFTLSEWSLYFPNEPHRKTCEQWPLESEAVPMPTP